METVKTRVAISGGGPAGIMLGYLLARAGIDVVILEKWPDFFRDFRGDTIHPSTMQILKELGLLEKFLTLPHNETKEVEVHFGTEKFIVADFTHLKTGMPFIGFIPQWDFLNFLAEEGKKFPGFHLMMATEAVERIEEGGKTLGLKAKNAEGEFEIRAELVVGADGRHSTIRETTTLPVENLGAPIDVLWFRLSRQETHTDRSLGYVGAGHMMVLLDRDTYWQCAFLIRKGGFDAIKEKGIDAFQKTIAGLVPELSDAVRELTDWDKIKLLSVAVDRVKYWHEPGLILIGDAAHAMSPVGGVGINIAVQDAVAAANILAKAFKRPGGVTEDDLCAIEARRSFPARLTQKAQVAIHTHVLEPILEMETSPHAPWQVRLIAAVPLFRRLVARAIGVGIRPEHVDPALLS